MPDAVTASVISAVFGRAPLTAKDHVPDGSPERAEQ